MAHVLVGKYADHLPLYRQSQIYARQGIELDRSTLVDWVGRAAAELQPLHERLLEHLLRSPKLFMDETRAPVLDPGRKRTKTGYLWAIARDDRSWAGPDPPAVVYLYAPGRGAEQAIRPLAGFSGVLQVDAYAAYNALAEPGAGVPACLLILRKQRPKERRGKVLLVYAARHYRELSAKNELRPQDVMRMLVHVHAYGDSALVPGLAEDHKARLIAQIDEEERQEVERLNAFYEPFQQRLDKIDADIAVQERKLHAAKFKGERSKIEKVIAKLESQRKGPSGKISERDEKIAEAERKAENDREQVIATGRELTELYADPDELLKHARVVGTREIEENEYNLNIPRYVDTFEPEPRLEVKDALEALASAERELSKSEQQLRRLMVGIGYAA